MDLAAINQQLSQSPGASVPFGGTTINLATVGNDYHDFFLADGLHPGTVAQGIIADLFLNAFNDHFGTSVRPLSPTESSATGSRSNPASGTTARRGNGRKLQWA